MSAPSNSTERYTDRQCGITALFPLSMSCRGKAEAFARRLQSKLRTLGAQGSNGSPEDGVGENSWLGQNDASSTVTNIQPIRQNEADAFFDFDMEPESPGSPVDECEYSRLIETASNTPHDIAPESGYVCASPISQDSCGSHSSSDGPYYDPELSESEQKSTTCDFYDCIESKRDATMNEQKNTTVPMSNGHSKHIPDNDSTSESLPPSQSTTTSVSHISQACSSASNSTLQDESIPDMPQSTSSPIKQEDETEQVNGKTVEEEEEEVGETTDTVIISESNGTDEVDNAADVTKSNEIHIYTNPFAAECPNIMTDVEEIPAFGQSRTSPTNSDPDNANGNGNGRTEHLCVSETDDDDSYDDRPQRVRRCSSLKTGKTPPGTPGRKKIVRFADVLGLDLADVRTFMDEMPKIPKQAYEDLEVIDQLEQTFSLGPRPDKLLMPLFQQPGGLPGFLDVVRDKQVCLENAAVTDTITLTITGSVRVRNLDFHKSVYVRYTVDGWRSFSDLQATYVENSCDGFSDKFTFILFGNCLQMGQRLELAVRFQCRGEQFWDNNYGTNYCFQCLPATSPSLRAVHIDPMMSPVDPWCSSFY